MAKVIMIQGTMSNAGKSLLTAGLCRIFRQDGYTVAPFKSQNMALNSYITDEGLEMGRAQVMQAEAAGIAPEAAMNPILLKPTSQMGSQLIVNGEVRGNYSAAAYYRMKKGLMPEVLRAYRSLAERFDILVIEGAGSPAEINLRKDDLVNMGLAEAVDAPVLLVGDIDRGGVFAQLYGTAALLTEAERARIRAFVINKFRGDAEILKPGLSMLYERIPIPVAGIVPYMDVDIDDEDSLAERLSGRRGQERTGDGERESPDAASVEAVFARIAVVRLPRISNFTDFNVLERLPGIRLSYVTRPEELSGADMIILPGTKNTMGDLKWLRETGLEPMIRRRAGEGALIFGVCGGFQMLGETLADPCEVEEGGVMRGIGLLPVRTVFAKNKTRTRVQGIAVGFGGAAVDGYEIHMGETERTGGERFAEVSGSEGSRPAGCGAEGSGSEGNGSEGNRAGRSESCGSATHRPHCGNKEDGCVCGNVCGTYLHGVFDSEEMARTVWDRLAEKKGVPAGRFAQAGRLTAAEYKERQYEKIAAVLRESLDMRLIYRILNREDTAHAAEIGR